MISLNALDQINDIITILDNTRKAVHKPQSSGNFTQDMQQAIAQTPAQIVQQTIVKPDANSKSAIVKKCLYCGKDVTGDMPFCDESHASLYKAYGPRRQ